MSFKVIGQSIHTSVFVRFLIFHIPSNFDWIICTLGLCPTDPEYRCLGWEHPHMRGEPVPASPPSTCRRNTPSLFTTSLRHALENPYLQIHSHRPTGVYVCPSGFNGHAGWLRPACCASGSRQGYCKGLFPFLGKKPLILFYSESPVSSLPFMVAPEPPAWGFALED